MTKKTRAYVLGIKSSNVTYSGLKDIVASLGEKDGKRPLNKPYIDVKEVSGGLYEMIDSENRSGSVMIKMDSITVEEPFCGVIRNALEESNVRYSSRRFI